MCVHPIRSLAVFAAVELLLCGCAINGGPRPGDSFRLRVGEMVRAGEVTIRFVEVACDSRCPVAVTCVWEGDAEVRIAVDGETVSLHTAGNEPHARTLGNITVELLELHPRPHAPPETTPPYEAELRAQ
jgi:hypothetical protein